VLLVGIILTPREARRRERDGAQSDCENFRKAMTQWGRHIEQDAYDLGLYMSTASTGTPFVMPDESLVATQFASMLNTKELHGGSSEATPTVRECACLCVVVGSGFIYSLKYARLQENCSGSFIPPS
jgi:hypothetical protein